MWQDNKLLNIKDHDYYDYGTPLQNVPKQTAHEPCWDAPIGRNKLNNLEFIFPDENFIWPFRALIIIFQPYFSLLGGNKFEKWPSTVTPQVR